MITSVSDILKENEKRLALINTPFYPITGKNSIGERQLVVIEDFPIRRQYLPVEMLKIPLVKKLIKHGSVKGLLDELERKKQSVDENFAFDDYYREREKVIGQFVKLRCRYDFAFWAAFYVFIKNKGGGEDVRFRLTRPQRRFVERLEALRKAKKPIRLILLKARQWGGSTTSQIYMAWLQLMHRKGLNSLIIAHQGTGSDEIKDMFDRMIKQYPVEMLYKINETYNDNESKLESVGHSGNIHRVPQRNCKIKIGTAERPDSCRGGDYNLVHLSEVGIWKVTEGKKPEDIVRSATSGILYKPYTMIVYESTANGAGNFFHIEYDDAKKGKSQFEALFISWFDIDIYSLPFENEKERLAFANSLYENRNNTNESSSREVSGKYLWWLWNKGATLEAINWYIHERKKYTDHGLMAAEYPSDDVEAFVHSGARVFDKYKVEELKRSCRNPKLIGEVYADGDEGKKAFKNLRFKDDRQGSLYIWSEPETYDNEECKNRYLTVVDVGGRSNKSDFSAIVVFDRLFMMDGDKPVVAAQWYGHIDIDQLAWKAAQIAAYYDNSLLVIESNTLETHDKERDVEGDMSHFILNLIADVYPGELYARKQSEEDIREKAPVKYGFHTNTATKPMIIHNLVKVIRDKMYVERDERCLFEYLCYEKRQNGSYGAITGKHDDLLMTRAIGMHICYNEMELPKFVKKNQYANIRRARPVTEATI